MPEFIDPVFAKTSPKRSFSMSENERFGMDFVKTGFINSGTALYIRKYFVVETAQYRWYEITEPRILGNAS